MKEDRRRNKKAKLVLIEAQQAAMIIEQPTRL